LREEIKIYYQGLISSTEKKNLSISCIADQAELRL
jgi:hypothetical protein